MMEAKVTNFHSQKEKELVISGLLSLPLRVNERAMIYRGGKGSILTSPVKEILEVSAYSVVFRTCNTLYRLSYTPISNENEVMCA